MIESNRINNRILLGFCFYYIFLKTSSMVEPTRMWMTSILHKDHRCFNTESQIQNDVAQALCNFYSDSPWKNIIIVLILFGSSTSIFSTLKVIWDEGVNFTTLPYLYLLLTFTWLKPALHGVHPSSTNYLTTYLVLTKIVCYIFKEIAYGSSVALVEVCDFIIWT